MSVFYNMFLNFVSKKSLLSFESKLVFLFSNRQRHVILSCFNIRTIAVLLPLRRADILDFPQSRSAKLQQSLPTEEGEQQPLWQLQAVKRTWTHSWSVVVKVMTLLSPLKPMGIFRFWRNGKFTFFPEISVALLFFLDPHPLPGQVFRFALSSSLAILSALSMIRQKYIRENRGLWAVYIRGNLNSLMLLVSGWHQPDKIVSSAR